MGEKELTVIIEVDLEPVGNTCVVLTKHGKQLIQIVAEPIAGFFQSASGSLYPKHSVRGVARVTIEDKKENTDE